MRDDAMTMHILLVNPNITDAITEVMAREARRIAAPDTRIVTATAAFGALYIENRAEAAIASHAVLDALAERAKGMDAVIVSAFGDPGVAAAKELMSMPVVGITEAALLTAWSLGRRYAIVCMTERLRLWYQEAVVDMGLGARLVAVRAVDATVSDVTRAYDELAQPALESCLAAVEEDGAEVVVLGGGPMAGLAHRIAARVPVPLLDGVTCAVPMAEALVRMQVRKAERGSFARPRAKPSTGLSAPLSKMIEHDD